MIDIHLINMALAVIGVLAGSAIVIAAAIIVIAAIREHRISWRAGQPRVARTVGPATSLPRESGQAEPGLTEPAPPEPGRREPALRY